MNACLLDPARMNTLAYAVKRTRLSVEVEHTNRLTRTVCRTVQASCPFCGGQYYAHKTCPHCDGTGTVLMDRWEEVRPINDTFWEYEKIDMSCGYETILDTKCIPDILSCREWLEEDFQKFEVNSRCGGHVHVDWTDQLLGGDERKTLENILYLGRILDNDGGEQFWEFMGIDDCRARGHYGHENMSWWSSLSFPARDDYEDHWEEVVKVCLQYYGANCAYDMPVCGGDRSFINLRNISSKDTKQKNTVEFRFWDSPKTFDAMLYSMAWSASFLYVCNLMEKEEVGKAWEAYKDKPYATARIVMKSLQEMTEEVIHAINREVMNRKKLVAM